MGSAHRLKALPYATAFALIWALPGAFCMQSTKSEKTESPNSSPNNANREIVRLQFMIGIWQASDTYEKNPFAPEGGSGNGIYKTILGPGGFSILTDYRYRGPQGESSGHQVLTWNAEQGCYLGYIVTANSPGVIPVGGHWDGPNFILSGNFKLRGRRVEFKQVFSDIAAESMTLRQYNSVDGAPPQLFGATKFTRK